jgi:ABC-2 type transport system ATP-binding protein
MIQTNNLRFKYGRNSQHIFENLNIKFEKGSIYGLLGENGVGKTTFLRLLSGLLFPQQGTVEVSGFAPRKREAAFLRQIYYFPENLEIIDKSIVKYAKMYAPFYPKFSKKYFNYCISEFGVNPNVSVNTLSQGNRKKALLAFAFACNTEILLLDEPTNGLDIPSKTIFRRLLSESKTDEKIVVISTHQVREVEDLINLVIIMEYNQILLNNSIKEIKRKFAENILPNNGIIENDKINLEALFNAAIENKSTFKNTFLQ